MNEQKIAQRALAQLNAHTGLQLCPLDVSPVLGTGLWPDMRIRINHTQIELIAEIHQVVSKENVSAVIRQLNLAAGEQPAFLIADRINRELASQLRENNVNYLDVAGNAYLNIPPFFILIDGRQPTEPLPESRAATQFSPAELKVVFALLARPELLNANYGTIAEHSNVALGVVGTIVRKLKDRGYFVETGSSRRRRWRERQKLIARWVEQYPNLRNKHYLGSFHTPERNWWQSEKLKKYHALLGGDFAAVCYSKLAKPTVASVYLDDSQQWLFLRDMGFVKSSQATPEASFEVKVFSKFWGNFEPQEAEANVTHPLITYADLVELNNPRNRAAANDIALRYFSGQTDQVTAGKLHSL